MLQPYTAICPWPLISTQWDGGLLLPKHDGKPKHRTSFAGAAKRSNTYGTMGAVVQSLYLKGWIIQHQRPWEQMSWWQGVSLQRRRLFGLLITASSSKRSLWWAKYKVMHAQTHSHSSFNQDYKTVREVRCYLTNNYCIKTYLTHITQTLGQKEWTACWRWTKAMRPGVKPTVSSEKGRHWLHWKHWLFWC